MSYQQYERVPLVENGVPLEQFDPSYFTGIPNTAPPSFRSVASANRHRNISFSQSTTAQENEEEDPGISLWGGSSMDAESVRENTIMMLMNRVESLENRLEEQQQQQQQQQQQPLADKEEVDLEAQAQKKRKDFWTYVGVSIAVSIFSLWFMAVILLSVWAKVEYARNKSIGQLNNNGL